MRVEGFCYSFCDFFFYPFLSNSQLKIAEMATRLESARLLTWKAAMLKDANMDITKVCLPFRFLSNEDSS